MRAIFIASQQHALVEILAAALSEFFWYNL